MYALTKRIDLILYKKAMKDTSKKSFDELPKWNRGDVEEGGLN